MPGPSAGFPVPPLQKAPDIELRPDGTFSDPSYGEDIAVVRVTSAPDVLVLDIFYNRFLSECGPPSFEERQEPVEPTQERVNRLGNGMCLSERLVEIKTMEKRYCEVRGRWERWVMPEENRTLLDGLESRPPEAPLPDATNSVGLGQVVTVQQAAGVGALDTSTDISFGDVTGSFYLADQAHLGVLKTASRKVAEGLSPVGYWNEIEESDDVAPRQDWKPEGDPYPCPEAPLVGGEDVIAVPAPPDQPDRRWWIWLIPVLLLLFLLWLLLFSGDDGAEPVPTTAAAADTTPATSTTAPTTTGSTETTTETTAPVEQVGRAALTQIHSTELRQETTGFYFPNWALIVVMGVYEIYFGTFDGSVVLFNTYGPEGAIPLIAEGDEAAARAAAEVFMSNSTTEGSTIDVDWPAVFAGLGADPAVVCGGRVVLDIEADQGGVLPGFGADGTLAGSGTFTGEAGDCQDFPIQLEGSIAP